jgi:predicted transcriptional regulator
MRGNIVFYILLMRFASGSVADFLRKNMSYSYALPFGVGPWVCVNPICPQHSQKVILKCTRKVHEWVTGYFTCPYCGMTYYRRGLPHVEDENLYSIESMGELFIKKAIKYFHKGFTIKQIADLLQSNRTTVRKYLKPYRTKIEKNQLISNQKVELGEIQKGVQEVAVANQMSKLEVSKATIMENIRKLGGNITRPQIRKVNSHRYDYVMKHDRAWMEKHLPKRKELPTLLNLETLDGEMFRLVSKTVEELWRNPPKEKITRPQIFKALPSYIQGRCKQYRAYLPKTLELIENSLETDDQYFIRNFPNVVEWFNESRYKTLSLKLIQNRFRSYKKCSPWVIQWIEEQISSINKL